MLHAYLKVSKQSTIKIFERDISCIYIRLNKKIQDKKIKNIIAKTRMLQKALR